MDIFERIKQKTRAFIPFDVEINGSTEKLYARRISSGDSQLINLTYETAYQKEREAFKDTDEENTSLHSVLARQKPESLAQFISNAEEDDRKSEASTLCDDQPCDDAHPEVQALAKQLQAERTAWLKQQPFEALLRLSMERRAHFNAMAAGVDAQTKVLTSLMIWADKLDDNDQPTGEKVKLFENPSAVSEYPTVIVTAILKAARTALDKDSETAPLS